MFFAKNRVFTYIVAIVFSLSFVASSVSFANPAAIVYAVGEAINIGASIYTISEFAGVVKNQLQQWLEDHPGSTPSQYPGYTGGVTIDDDGFSGHDGEFEGPVDYHGFGSWKHDDKSFNDFDSAYQDYVSDLPCGSSYDSTGKLLWSPECDFEFDFSRVNSEKFNCTSSENHFSIVRNTGVTSGFVSPSVVRLNIISADTAPISGTYVLQNYSEFVFSEFDLGLGNVYKNYYNRVTSFSSSFNQGDSFNYSRSGNIDNDTRDYICFVGFVNSPTFEITPLSINDTVITNNYNDNSRAWSLSGDLAITNVSGDLTTINPSVKIVNETNNTYTNPETGITYPVSDWTYDYSDRSYTLHLDTTNVEEGDTIGGTVVVTFGDENITINEQHITYEGDTPVTTTETIPVYYIIENPQSQDPDDPGTVVDPGSDPDDSGSSCLCTHIGQQIAAGAFAYTNSGSGDFYSYVNIANGGTTTNNNTYNYYGSGPHDPTPPNPNSDPENPDDPGTDIEPVTPCANNDHWFVITEDVPATCTLDGYRKGKCSECGLEQMISYTPAYGHNWEGPYIVGETVELNPGQDPFMTEESRNTCFYVCSRCGLHYVVPSMDSPAPPATYDPENEPGFLQNVPSAFSALANIFNNIISTVVDMCSSFTNFLVAVFPFIPTEFITVLELGFVLFIAAGVIRYFLR